MSEIVTTRVVQCNSCRGIGFVMASTLLSDGTEVLVVWCMKEDIKFRTTRTANDYAHAIVVANDNGNHTPEDVLPTLDRVTERMLAIIDSYEYSEPSDNMTDDLSDEPVEEVIEVEETPEVVKSSREDELQKMMDKQIYEDSADECSKCDSGKYNAKSDHRKHDNGTMNPYWKDG